MSNYEIMILVNPKSTEEEVTTLLHSVLPKESTKIQRLERTELAYEIKKLNRANYYLVSTKADPQSMAEFTRKLNITKSVLRTLVINLDSEKGLKPRKQKRFSKYSNRRSNDKTARKSYTKRNSDSAEKVEKKQKTNE